MPHALAAADNLYTALRHSGAAPDDLPALIAASAPETAARLRAVDPGLLRAILRAGPPVSGSPAISTGPALRDWLARCTPAPLFRPALAHAPTLALLTAGQHPDMPAFSDRAFDAWFAAKGVTWGLGLYGEHRTVYETPQFADAASPERRTVHLGIDVFAPAGTPVYAPLAGTVRHVTYNADPLDYGHTLILDHDGGGIPFHSLYGHLGGTLLTLCRPGDRIAPGQIIAHLGDWHENGGWAPHLHFQIMSDMLDQSDGNFFGVGHASLWDIWSAICPDPNLILRLPDAAFRLG